MLSVKNTGLGVSSHGFPNSVTLVILRFLFSAYVNESDQTLFSLTHRVGGCEHPIRQLLQGEEKRELEVSYSLHARQCKAGSLA